MIVVLLAGIAVILAGLLAIGFGIPVKEFGFGNTLILTGTIGVCTGLILVGLAQVLRELRTVSRRLAAGDQLHGSGAQHETPALPVEADTTADRQTSSEGPLFTRDQAPDRPSAEPAVPAAPPWQDDAARGRERARSSETPAEKREEAPADVKPRRNLLFASSSRKERERAAAATEPDGQVGAPSADPEIAPRTFDDAWPQPEKSRPDAQRRPPRPPPSFEAAAPRSANEPVPVTVLKSGVVDGMAYSLYSDGSIEAQMPEGMMRFASIDELREHLDHRA